MNPEFRRNLWMELTVHRLIAAPVLLLLLFGLIGMFNDFSVGAEVASAALLVFSALTALWGPHLATDAVLDEVRAHTWDTQKLSALEPWTMTWGKLAGATSFTWYGGLFCAGVYLVAAHELATDTRLYTVLAVVSGAVLVQSLGFATALVMLNRGSATHLRSSWLTLILVFAFLFLGLPLASADSTAAVTWYDRRYDAVAFVACTVAWLAAASLLWAWRSMCVELQVRTLPWAVSGFIVIATAYLAGFEPGSPVAIPVTLRLAAALTVVAGVMTYLCAALDPKDPITLRRLLLARQHGAWRRVAEDIPTWFVALGATALGALLCLVMGLPQGAAVDDFERYAIAALAMLLRDLALLHVFAFAAVPRRVEATTLLYLVVANALVPALFGLMGASWLGYAFFPMPLGPWPATGVFLLQFAVLATIAYRRWSARATPLGVSAPR